MMRFRITYQKTEELRYTGNLDLHKIWERYLRRANLPVAYSQGFHPQPRIQQACPLPLGFLALKEQIDIFIDSDQITAEMLIRNLQAASYPGISLLSVDSVAVNDPAVTTRVEAAEYRVEFLDKLDPAELEKRVTDLLAAEQLIRSRRGKEYDLRPLIEEMSVSHSPEDGTKALSLRLAARQGATGRPEEVISALGYDPFSARYIRTNIVLSPHSN